MHNCVYLVGRLASDPTVENKGKKKYILMNVKVEHITKTNDEYGFEVIPVEIYMTNVEAYLDHIHKDDLVGIKGYLTCKSNKISAICDKLSFLSRKDNEDEKNQ